METLKCNVRLANLMSRDAHQSELLTQLFYNDRVIQLETSGEWIQVQLKYNESIGWALKSQFESITTAEFVLEPISICSPILNHGRSILPGTFSFDDKLADGFVRLDSFSMNAETIQEIVKSFLAAPYMWGGMSECGIDCSGFSQLLYRFFKRPLTSFAAEQFQQGIVLDFLQDARCGDLAFFEEEDGSITHVGILLSSSEIIHATEKAGRVVIDLIDQAGIISKRDGKRTHKLRMVKRMC